VIRDTVIVAAKRTPIGRAVKGGLADVRAEDLLTAAITGALDRIDGLDATTIDDLIAGAWMQTRDQGGNLARRAGVLMGLDSVPGVSVNRACTSSLQAIRMAHHAIALGEADTIIAAGVESISHYEDPRAAGSTPMADRHPAFADAGQHSRDAVAANPRWQDPRDNDQLPDLHLAMGHTAENVAGLRGIGRQEQDDFALRSQRLTADAVTEGFFAREIVPVATSTRLVDADESPRPDTTAQGLAALRPVFRSGGTVTAGNCCPLNDGAAAVVLMSAQRATDLCITPLARIVATGVSALSPEIMGLGPVTATQRALTHAGMTVDDIDLVEINEAFAAQVLPCIHDLEVDLDIVNVHGGAIALGHPFGMGGARLTTTLLNGMATRDASVGLVTMCAAGGQGMTLIVERV